MKQEETASTVAVWRRSLNKLMSCQSKVNDLNVIKNIFTENLHSVLHGVRVWDSTLRTRTLSPSH